MVKYVLKLMLMFYVFLMFLLIAFDGINSFILSLILAIIYIVSIRKREQRLLLSIIIALMILIPLILGKLLGMISLLLVIPLIMYLDMVLKGVWL